MNLDFTLIENASFLAFTLVFLGGILTSIGPCNVAMIPLVVGYVGGSRDLPRVRAFVLPQTFRRPHGFMTLHTDKVYITQVVDATEGLQLFEALQEAINVTWEKRAELVTVTAKKRAPRHLDIWELLPRSNCGPCGESTCLAFAVAVIQHKRALTECPPLQSGSSFADRKATLEAML